MLLSKKWLNQYVKVDDLSSEKLADTLTQLGIEVEGIEEKPSLDPKIVVGKIVSANKHPNADSLKLCEVQISDNQEENLSIVCGAPNARENLYVAVACLGAKLPDGLKIKKTKVRSEPSLGMMCSEKELEISDNNDGILEIEQKVSLGQKISNLFDTSDSILDLSITPNRSDCLSYIGLARDLCAKLERELKYPSYDYTPTKIKTKDTFTLKVEATEQCKRFMALSIKDYKHTTSPAWLIKSIEKNGMRSVNLIVDLTNYVMLEQGQPIHAYDKKTLEDNQISVKIATEKNSFKTLDDKTVATEAGDILITDGKKIIGLAGVMGGLNSEVTETTTEIIIEVAHFARQSIRKTSKRLALHTDASHRFERGVDSNNIPLVIKRIAYLLQKCLLEKGLTPCSIAAEAIDFYPKVEKSEFVKLRTDRIRKLLNLPQVTTEECIKKLEALGLKALEKSPEKTLFKIPSWRHDLTREVDLIEEVGRLIGFDKIPSQIPSMCIAPNHENPFVAFQDDCKFAFAAMGFSEVITYPFSSTTNYSDLLCQKENQLWPHVQLQNALNEQESYMQTSLIPSLLKATAQNRNYGHKSSHFFEVGRGYFDLNELDSSLHKNFIEDMKHNKNHLESNSEKNLVERTYLSGLIDSPQKEKCWRGKETRPSFYDVKTLIKKFFYGINLHSVTWEVPDENERPFLHPKASAKILHKGITLGYIGELHPRAAKNYELGADIPVLFELDLERCLASSENKVKVEALIKKFPPVSRDLSFLLKETISFAQFKEAVDKNPRKKHLANISLFDVYQGEKITKGFKSFASEFTFQAKDKTLSEKEINKEVDALIKHLEKELEATQR